MINVSLTIALKALKRAKINDLSDRITISLANSYKKAACRRLKLFTLL